VDIGCAGASHGSLTLIAGGSLTLTAGRMIVGSDANGDYTQSGGAFSQGSTGPVYIANNAPSGGTTVSISGGTFASAGDIHLCVRDNAAFTISGGTVTAPHFYFGTLGASGAAGTGTLNLNGGTLVVGAVALNNSANTANLYFNGGTLQASAASIAFLTGLNVTQIKSGGAYINDGSYAITMGQALAPYSGSTGGLTKCGTGTLTLSGANTYAGSTTVSNGTLALTGSGSISNSSTIAVAFGATLDASQRSDGTLALGAGQSLTGQGVVKGNIMVGSGAMLAPGNSIGALICSNNLTLGGGSTTFMELSKSPVTNDVAQVAGTLVYGGTLRLTNVSSGSFAAGDSFKLFSAVSFSGAFTNLVPAIPAVDLAWDTSGLTNGTLRVVSAPTPQPFLGVNVNGRVLVFSGSNGVPGWPGCLLAGTNLLEPFSNWTIAATNLFDGNGNCNFTNSADPNWPQSFYLIKLE